MAAYVVNGRLYTVESKSDPDGALRAEEYLQQVARDNELEQLDQETEWDAAVIGDSAYKVTWDGTRPVITSPDMSGLYAWWRPDNLAIVYQVAHRLIWESELAAEAYGVVPKERGAVGVTEVWTDRQYDVYYGADLVIRRVNPYGWIPYVIVPNDRRPKEFWGFSDLLAIEQSQSELNRAYTQLSRLLEISGNPILALIGVQEAKGISIAPGQTLELPEDSEAYILDLLKGGAATAHLEYIERVYRTIHDLGEAPRASFGEATRAQSGVALDIEMQPLIQKVARKRALREPALRRRSFMCLDLARQFGRMSWPDDMVIKVRSAPVVPRDWSRMIDDERLRVTAGLTSRHGAMERLGVEDADGELNRWMDEQGRLVGLIEGPQADRGHEGGRRSGV